MLQWEETSEHLTFVRVLRIGFESFGHDFQMQATSAISFLLLIPRSNRQLSHSAITSSGTCSHHKQRLRLCSLTLGFHNLRLMGLRYGLGVVLGRPGMISLKLGNKSLPQGSGSTSQNHCFCMVCRVVSMGDEG